MIWLAVAAVVLALGLLGCWAGVRIVRELELKSSPEGDPLAPKRSLATIPPIGQRLCRDCKHLTYANRDNKATANTACGLRPRKHTMDPVTGTYEEHERVCNINHKLDCKNWEAKESCGGGHFEYWKRRHAPLSALELAAATRKGPVG